MHLKKTSNWGKLELHRWDFAWMSYYSSHFVIVAVYREKFRPTSRGEHLTERVTTQTYASFDAYDFLQNDHPLDEYVVFVTPTALQLAIFSRILHPDKLDDLVQSSTAESLALINMLTKVSNSPILLKATADKAKSYSEQNLRHATISDALKLIPESAQIDDVSLSGKPICHLPRHFKIVFLSTGKLTALAKLLQVIRSVKCYTSPPL